MISEEMAAFFEAGHSVHIGARGPSLEPSGTRAWAVTVHPDRRHLTAFVMTAAAKEMLADMKAHPEVALTFSRVSDHVTWQAKGTCVGVRPARPSERARVADQAEMFRASLVEIGIAAELTAAWRFWPCVAVRIRVGEMFNQTPGPGAGERVP
jgi:hypothetical protein